MTGRPGTERNVEREAALLSGDALPPLLPPGDQYVVRTRHSVRIAAFGRKDILKLYVEVIGGGEYDGSQLFWCAQLPAPGRRPGLSSKFFRAWLLVAARRPQRGERLSPKMLEKKQLRVRVDTVTHDYRGQPLPSAAQYSIVRDLLERLA